MADDPLKPLENQTPEVHADDKAIIIAIGGSAFCAGLFGFYEGYPILGTVFTIGGLVTMATISPFVRSRVAWPSGYVALWTLAVVTWLSLAADIGLKIYDQWWLSPPQPNHVLIAEATAALAKERDDALSKAQALTKENVELKRQLDSAKQSTLPAQSPQMQTNYPRIIPAPDAGELPTVFAGISNVDLKATVARITGELRLLNANYQRQFKAVESASLQGVTGEEQRSELVVRKEKMDAIRADENQKFKRFTEIRPLYFELLNRLSKLPAPPVSPKLPPPMCGNCISPVLGVIYSPTVFGETTLTDLADYLDALAALIPASG